MNCSVAMGITAVKRSIHLDFLNGVLVVETEDGVAGHLGLVYLGGGDRAAVSTVRA